MNQIGNITENSSGFSLLRHRDFCVFWTGSFLSSIGTQFTTVAMAWQIYELTNSPLQIGLLGLARALPQIALLLVGGLLADAVNRRSPRWSRSSAPSSSPPSLPLRRTAALTPPPRSYPPP